MLEREGQPPITIEEMNEAGISKAAEAQKVLNTAQKRRRTSSGGSHRRTKRQ